MKKVRSEFIGQSYFKNNLNFHINRWKEGFENPHHIHDFIEITIIEEGKGFHHVDDHIIPVNKGELFLIPIGASHVFRPTSPTSIHPLTVYNVLFDRQVLDSLMKETTRIGDTSLSIWLSSLGIKSTFSFLHVSDHQDICLNLIRSMYFEYQQKQPGYPIIVTAKIHELMLQLFRMKHRHTEASLPKLSVFAIDEVVSYMTEHLNQTITLAHVANKMNVSERHFSRMFKKYTGQTFNEYLQNKRIERSCELLVTTDLSIKEISYFIGYKDTDHFRKLFTKKLGLSPHQYRKNV
ncbi:AraC family transcriptional regulator [Halalkalibacter akibai]|uniref:Two-component response regulator n=1 Tax=Halalkalibacter akibai (strain ATCC 43226 / DSM 21942 / CIP 109018 / JCM 9157 / 1139) TaxID=1236973 RepID=W4QVT3_HALA3|nr:AraC family transcriptional regulator [Halalkalibacter akibai]GAE35997.1 two-component response regulator [Halalkalibacter akibai JCM 9157]